MTFQTGLLTFLSAMAGALAVAKYWYRRSFETVAFTPLVTAGRFFCLASTSVYGWQIWSLSFNFPQPIYLAVSIVVLQLEWPNRWWALASNICLPPNVLTAVVSTLFFLFFIEQQNKVLLLMQMAISNLIVTPFFKTETWFSSLLSFQSSIKHRPTANKSRLLAPL